MWTVNDVIGKDPGKILRGLYSFCWFFLGFFQAHFPCKDPSDAIKNPQGLSKRSFTKTLLTVHIVLAHCTLLTFERQSLLH